MSNARHLTLEIVGGQETDAEELDRLTRQLRDEIAEVGVESLEMTRAGPPPPGAKSADALTLGALAIAVLPAVAPKLIETVQAWTHRGGESRTVRIKTQVGDRSVEVEFSPKHMPQAELKNLVDTLAGTLTAKS